MSERRILDVVRLSMRAARARVGRYSCIKSRHGFTQPQRITCLVLRAFLRTTYRGVVELLAEMPDVRDAMGLIRLPHFTTLQKFNGKSRVVEATMEGGLRSVTGEPIADIRDAAMHSTSQSMTKRACTIASACSRIVVARANRDGTSRWRLWLSAAC